MRSTKSKNQNKQIPSEQGRAAEQSPLCLIPGDKGPCNHKHCLLAFKKPKYWGISIVEFYNTHDFAEFDIVHSMYGPPHIIPHNPNTKVRNNFEAFRQSQNAIIHLTGEWPLILNVVPREYVEFRWTECVDTVPVFNPETFETKWVNVLDVKEFAYYVGPAADLKAIKTAVIRLEKGAGDE